MDNIRQFTLREPQPTDKKLDFKTYHDLVMAVARTLGIDISGDPTIQPILLMELDEDLPQYDEGATRDATSGKMPYIDKKGTVLYFDPTTQTWKRDETQQKVTLCNPYEGTSYATGDRVLFRYLQQGAKFVPFAAVEGGKARKLTVTADFAFDASNNPVAVHVTDWGDPDTTAADPDPDDLGIEVTNELGLFYGDQGWQGFAELMSNDPLTYRLYQGECPAQDE